MSLEEYRHDMEMCTRCSLCKLIPLERVADAAHAYGCPSIARHGFHAYSAAGRLSIGSALIDGHLEPSAAVSRIAYDCLLCGSCDVSCKYAMDMEVLEPMRELRASCVQAGCPIPVHEDLVRRMERDGRALAPSASSKHSMTAHDLGVKDASRGAARVLYHLGCQVGQDPELGRVAQAAASLLTRADVEVASFGEEESCCGIRALELGYKQQFLAQAGRFLEAIEFSGAEVLVTGCAHCYQALKVEYPRVGKRVPARVMHITELLLELITSGRLALPEKLSLKVTYQDPCHLGRLGEPFVAWEGVPVPGHRRMFEPAKPWRRGTHGVYQAPRDLLRSVPELELAEMNRIKEYAWCCGGGGGVPAANPEFALWTARERLREAKATGADAIVTACPGCKRMLERAGEADGAPMAVLDVAELVNLAVTREA